MMTRFISSQWSLSSSSRIARHIIRKGRKSEYFGYDSPSKRVVQKVAIQHRNTQGRQMIVCALDSAIDFVIQGPNRSAERRKPNRVLDRVCIKEAETLENRFPSAQALI